MWSGACWALTDKRWILIRKREILMNWWVALGFHLQHHASSSCFVRQSRGKWWGATMWFVCATPEFSTQRAYEFHRVRVRNMCKTVEDSRWQKLLSESLLTKHDSNSFGSHNVRHTRVFQPFTTRATKSEWTGQKICSMLHCSGWGWNALNLKYDRKRNKLHGDRRQSSVETKNGRKKAKNLPNYFRFNEHFHYFTNSNFFRFLAKRMNLEKNAFRLSLSLSHTIAHNLRSRKVLWDQDTLASSAHLLRILQNFLCFLSHFPFVHSILPQTMNAMTTRKSY